MTHARNDVDLRWAHPALARSARKIFRRVGRDAGGRLKVSDMASCFGRHGKAMLDAEEDQDGSGYACLCGRWMDVLKDWGVCTGVGGWSIGGEA